MCILKNEAEAEKQAELEAKKQELISLVDDLNFISSNVQYELSFENGQLKILPIFEEEPIPF